jgi:hypothetical protein
MYRSCSSQVLTFKNAKNESWHLGRTSPVHQNPAGEFSLRAVFGKSSTYNFASRLPPATHFWQKTNQPIIFIAFSLLFRNYCSVNSLYLFNHKFRTITSKYERLKKTEVRYLNSANFRDSFLHFFPVSVKIRKIDSFVKLIYRKCNFEGITFETRLLVN